MNDITLLLLLVGAFMLVLAIGMTVMDFFMGPDPDLTDGPE